MGISRGHEYFDGHMNYLLDYTTTVHLERQWENMAFHSVRQHGLLNLSAVLEQFLNDLHSSMS